MKLPITRRRLLLVLVLLLLLGGLLLVPQVRWPIYGWVRGEAFYQGMPTSWWVNEIEQSYEPLEVQIDTKQRLWGTCWVVQTPNSPWDRFLVLVMPGTTAVPLQRNVELLDPPFQGDPAALPVLLALVRAETAKVRRFAISGLVAQDNNKQEVIPALRQLMKDTDVEVREEAEAAWTLLDPEAAAKAGVK